MTKLISLCCILLLSTTALAQQPGFNRLYSEVPGSGIGDNIISEDSSFYVGSTTVTQEGYEAFLMKLDYYGEINWIKTYQIDSFKFEGGRSNSIVRTPNNGFAICGQLIEPITNHRWSCLLKLDNNGDSIWSTRQKDFGTYPRSGLYSMCKTSDSGFVAVGFAYSQATGQDLLAVKYNGQGLIQWFKTFGGSITEAGIRVIEVPNGSLRHNPLMMS